jgi:hypothetical protein
MIFANTGFVLTKGNIKHPVQAIFNLPMLANRVQKSLSGCLPTADEIAGGGFGFGRCDANGDELNQTGQLCPARPFPQIGKLVGFSHHPELTKFLPIMPLVGFLSRLIADRLIMVFLKAIEQHVHVMIQRSLIVLHR